MLNINLTGRVPPLVIGLLIFFLPFFTYLSPDNLRQLNQSSLIEISLSLTIPLIIIFISSYSIEILIKRFFKKKIILFPLFCFAFYLNFLYESFGNMFGELITRYLSDGVMMEAPIFILFQLFCLAIILFGAVFNTFSVRVIFIFSILMFTKAFIPLVYTLVDNIGNKQEIVYEVSDGPLAQDAVLVERNIYYIILDAMMGTEITDQYNIATKKEVLDKLSNTELKYIDNSQSSYSETLFSLTSVMLMDYHQKPDSPKNNDSKSFFPGMLYSMQDKVPLLSYLKEANSSFIWAAGKNFVCVPSVIWTCIESPQDFLPNSLFNFYLTTPFPKIISKFLKIKAVPDADLSRDSDTIGPFLEYIDKNGIPKNPFFAYIHHNIPHGPFRVTSECEPTMYFRSLPVPERVFEGYKASYKCALKTIQIFMEKINNNDPEAIVVFQGDHGMGNHLILKVSDKEKFLFEGNIFNAIKAPEICFEKYGLPRTNINTVRFILNCAYGFKLPYREDIHFHHDGHGNVIERKIYE
jgi:hypothetical protein